MKRSNNILSRLALSVLTTLGASFLVVAPVAAVAANSTASDQAHLQLIINRGNSEIGRRLSLLNTLSSKISGSTSLTSADAASLSSEVSSEVTGLGALKTQLDSETTLAAAKTDAQNIVNEYRVFALIVPKVSLVKVADAEQKVEAKLAALAPKLQSRVTAAKTAGKNVTSLQNALTDLSSKLSSATAISSSLETSVIALTPSDYNSNHAALSGDRAQLVTAQTDIHDALSDAKTVVSGLKNL